MWEEELRSDSQSSHDPRRDDPSKEPPSAIRSADRAESVHLTPSHVSLESLKLGNGHASQSHGIYPSWEGASRNESSTASLGPSESPVDGRRKLLLIYIHGFMGAETSFQKFPAHVHNLLTKALAESHVVYSKVYPQYKSRRSMNIARDDFSEWLQPHESDLTDVILLGHSLGGILSAEVALFPAESTNNLDLFKHRILGLINFDVPFLGLHPGIVGTGLASLFQPKRNPQSPNSEIKDGTSAIETPNDMDSGAKNSNIHQPRPSWFEQNPDFNYDPSFPNDIRRVKRSQLDGMFHFLKKNSGQMASAMKNYATSFFEFGGCLTDYPGLRRRYSRLKELEAFDNMDQRRDSQGRLLRRIRFVNYYTASPGFPKESPSEEASSPKQPEALDEAKEDRQPDTESLQELTEPSSPVSTIEPPEIVDNSMNNLQPMPIEEYEDMDDATQLNKALETSEAQSEINVDEGPTQILELLPPLPTIPRAPTAIDPSFYKDKEILKQAQKEYKRLFNLHEQAKKECDKTIKERKKLFEHLEKKKKRDSSSPSRLGAPEPKVAENTIYCITDNGSLGDISQNSLFEKRSASSGTLLNDDDRSIYSSQTNISGKPYKDRKFCVLPKNGGVPDPLWIRLFVPDVDEVLAHQSIFLPNGLYYEWLVGDTVTRIEQWVQDDSTRRLIWEHLDAEDAGAI
ncbi:hypothetical protein BGW36DRAFT_302474 [Talaromyces proteolyticus]|uniref:DUF676 domain-containing protein n=1 Tax=Talaromyces proteolyticus TaxID=1131652 RepID=A0AAD4KN32_9EURO|nr:uncharacterized protein BGW36DRAFT_302474 [Talaromyces proteolyticus]KAH8692935.1 hypothetical protein BGW36DRAFT_302474 [Talaromyces proteolyticus]